MIEERDRLITLYKARGMSDDDIEKELEGNKPMVESTTKITSKQNIGQSSLTVADKLQE